MVMKFAHIIWGNRAAQIGGNNSPSEFFDQNSSHLSTGRVLGPDKLYIWQTNFLQALDLRWQFTLDKLHWDWAFTKLLKVADDRVIFLKLHIGTDPAVLADTQKFPTPVSTAKIVKSNEPLPFVWSNHLCSVHYINFLSPRQFKLKLCVSSKVTMRDYVWEKDENISVR